MIASAACVNPENATTTVNKQVCKTVNDKSTKVVGYTVKYKYNGSAHTTRVDQTRARKSK